MTNGVSELPKFDCHCDAEYGFPTSVRLVTNLTPYSDQSSSNPSTMGAFD
tara:strand:- start:274 stop:423 length:150 start_codon:yes stop_codon:yes gene_type:complete